MYWQREVYRSSAVWTRGGTFRLELPDHGLLSAIMFHARVAQNTTGQQTYDKWRIMDFISELKIVGNGNRVLKSLTGRVAHYLNYLDGAPLMTDVHHNYGTSTLRHHGIIYFGRRMFDLDYGLDLAAWDSVEIQFTNDMGSGFTGNNPSIDVILYYLREASASQFKGYFKTEEWRKWTTVSDEWKYLSLPTEEMLRRLILQVEADEGATYHEAEATLYNVAYEIELKLRSGAVELWNSGLRDLWYDNLFYLGRENIVGIQPYHSDGYAIRTGLGQAFAYAGAETGHDGSQDTYAPTPYSGDDSHTMRRQCDGEADQEVYLVAGCAPECCALFPFDQEDDPTQYLDLARDGTVQLNIHTRSGASYADGTIRVILDRLIRGQGPKG